MADAALAILAKAPVPGLAKTRLIPALSAPGAARFQETLIRHTVRTACLAVQGPLPLGPVTLWCTPDIDHPCFADVARAHGADVELARQPEGDLGARMLAACARHPTKPTLVVGSDCPALTPALIQRAARCLHEGLDAVLVPAEDGGYVLIGLRTPDARVFLDMRWGHDQVLTQTRTRLHDMGWRWRELETLWDVDRPDDLRRLTLDFPELLA